MSRTIARSANNVILVNHATLGGHCRIGDHAILGGLSAVHQFVRIGESGFVGGMSGVENDVIPFGSAIGNRAELGGLNIVGLTRRGFSREAIHQLRRAYRTLFGPEGTLKERLADVEEEFAGRRERAEDRRLHPRRRRPRDLHAAGAERRGLNGEMTGGGRDEPIAILAGGGKLPLLVAAAALREGRTPVVFAIAGEAEAEAFAGTAPVHRRALGRDRPHVPADGGAAECRRGCARSDRYHAAARLHQRSDRISAR